MEITLYSLFFKKIYDQPVDTVVTRTKENKLYILKCH